MEGILRSGQRLRPLTRTEMITIGGTFERVGPRGKIIFDSNEIIYSGSEPAGSWYYIEIKDSRGQVYKLLAKK